MHIWQYIIVGVLILFSGIAKAIQDTLDFHFTTSCFKNLGNFWYPTLSWTRKYKNGDPKQGEAFLGSTTIFVAFTDAWHLFGLIRDFSLVSALAVATLNPWLLLGYIIFFGGFHILFTWVFPKK